MKHCYNGTLSKLYFLFNKQSPGEIKFFNKLKGITSSKIFYFILIRDHISNFMGEIDFLMIVPEKGILQLK